jgi:hypothetical protein
MMGKTTGGIRVKNQLPTILLPILEHGDIFDKCKVAIKSGSYTIEQVKTKLFPNGGLQERSENFGLFYVKQGKTFIQTLIENFKPLDLKFTILEE